MNSHQQDVYEQLEGMGYEKNDIERAWNACEIKTVEGLINWLCANPAQEEGVVEEKKNKNVNTVVKQEVVEEVMKKGHSRLVAEKAVLFSGNKEAKEAFQWIEEHKGDKDFEEPVEVEAKPKLTEEEAKLKAKELQAQIRQKAQEIDKQRELEAEKRRLQMGKEMAHAQRVLKEQQQTIAMKEYLRNKKKLEAEKNAMLKKLEEDKIARFGKDYVQKHVQPEEKDQVQEFNELYDKMYKIYRMGQIAELRTCMHTLSLYIGNILKNPQQEKFKLINSNNANFQKRVGQVIGGEKVLTLAGFEKNDQGYYELKSQDHEILQKLHTEIIKKTEALSQL